MSTVEVAIRQLTRWYEICEAHGVASAFGLLGGPEAKQKLRGAVAQGLMEGNPYARSWGKYMEKETADV